MVQQRHHQSNDSTLPPECIPDECRAESAEHTESAERTGARRESPHDSLRALRGTTVDDVIDRTLPGSPDAYKRSLFVLARELKALPQVAFAGGHFNLLILVGGPGLGKCRIVRQALEGPAC